jgi:hypothetical protein
VKKRNDGFFKLADEYKRLYLESKGDGFLFQIGRFRSVRGCLVHIYHVLIWEKQCEPIEKLSQHDKEELWKEAKRISEWKTKEEVIEVCKALHAFGIYIQM